MSGYAYETELGLFIQRYASRIGSAAEFKWPILGPNSGISAVSRYIMVG
jgi:hypothetical protein